ncbi:MAG: hypothetical protein F6K30_06195, partial [Cyanothece sp. SIO2G6]|nr:hypothetical protein [Cyanothece sp. SIO2G6]
SHLSTIFAETRKAHRLVEDTKAAMDTYRQKKPRLRQQIDQLQFRCQNTTYPILQELKSTYVSDVLRLVDPEGNVGRTIEDRYTLAIRRINNATEALDTAVGYMDVAQILTAAETLSSVGQWLDHVPNQLTKVETARDILSEKQRSVEEKYSMLGDPVQRMQDQLNNNFIRPDTDHLRNTLASQFKEAGELIQQTPHNPYDAEQCLKEVEKLREQVEKAIATDRQDFNIANDTIQTAEASIRSAYRNIAQVKDQCLILQVPIADFRLADCHFENAQASLGQARRSLVAKQYQDSIDQANKAIVQARLASQEADKVGKHTQKSLEAIMKASEEDMFNNNSRHLPNTNTRNKFGSPFPYPLDALKPDPWDYRKSNPLDDLKPDLLDALKPDPWDYRKPNPLADLKPDPLADLKSNPLDSQKSDPWDYKKSDPWDYRKPNPLADLKPDLLDFQKSDPWDYKKSDPLDDLKPDFLADLKPETWDYKKSDPFDDKSQEDWKI